MKENLVKFPADNIQQPTNITRSAPTTPVSRFPDFPLNSNKTNVNGQDEMGPSVSMAVHADDDASFHKSTFNLKRTRSMGLLDEYIDPTKTLLGRNSSAVNQHVNYGDRYVSMSAPITDLHQDCEYQIAEGEDQDQIVSNEDTNQIPEDRGTDEMAGDGDAGKVADDEGDGYGNENIDEDADEVANDEGDGYGNENIDEENEFEEGVFSGDRDTARHVGSENGPEETNRSVSVSPPPADNDDLLLPQDDNDLVREPERHVDYLSHEWNESDISNSWKYIILKKKKRSSVDHVNAARLENASWRTWAKARNHLATVSPEIVNWSKDSDVTWLYGPIIRENDDEDKNSEMGYGSDDETSKRVSTIRGRKKDFRAPKPILKKRSVEEILQDNSLWKLSEARKHKLSSSAADASSSVYYPADDYDDYDALAAKVNAQYYGSRSSHSGIDTNSSSGYSSDLANHTTMTMVDSYEAIPQAGNPLASSAGDIKGPNNEAPSNDDRTGSKSRPNENRHIHFNDRVEQCIAIAHPNLDIDFIDNNLYQDGHEEIDSYGSGSIMGDNENETLAQAANFSRAKGDSDASYSEDEEIDGDEDNAGLFITPAIPRRSDSTTHSPITDNSSTSSFKSSKLSLHPIIKLLPATTLNYGSDDDVSNNSEYDCYGSSVSHNVNTYRGYDYMYDYNSVYTGDTSSFLPVESCDVVDVPEGIDLHSAIAGDNACTYEFNHAALSDLDRELQVKAEQYQIQEPEQESHQKSNTSLFYNESEDSGFDSDEQFIEDSHYRSSEAEEEEEEEEEERDLSLKRIPSIGKTGSSNSMGDLSNLQPSNAVTLPLGSRSFISGKSLRYIPPPPLGNISSNNDNNNNDNRGNVGITSNSGHSADNVYCENNIIKNVENSTRRKLPDFPLKCIPSSSFIFDSESEEEEEEEEEGIVVEENGHGIGNCKRFEHPLESQSKIAPPRSSMILPTTVRTEIPYGAQTSDLSKSIRIKNSLSPAEVGASDVAISGSFSPVNDSIKSVVTNEGIINKGVSSSSARKYDDNNNNRNRTGSNDNDLRNVKVQLQDCHINENICNMVGERRDSNESVQKMMQNAREIANKYLHSWKKADRNSQATKSDDKSLGAD